MHANYYTEENRLNEERISEIYEGLYPGLKLIRLGGYSRYDRVAFRGSIKDSFIEIKKRSGAFPKWEFFSATKLEFTRKCGEQCYFVCERDFYAQVYNMSDIVRRFDEGQTRAIFLSEIIRRDRPIDAQNWEVLKFPSEWGKIIYYL